MTSSSRSPHVATLTYASRFWDVYVEFANDPGQPDSGRARLSFSPADERSSAHPHTVRTAVIILESTSQEAVAKARGFNHQQLVALLRSCLPADTPA